MEPIDELKEALRKARLEFTKFVRNNKLPSDPICKEEYSEEVKAEKVEAANNADYMRLYWHYTCCNVRYLREVKPGSQELIKAEHDSNVGYSVVTKLRNGETITVDMLY